jgi:starch phosphorylase
LLLQLRHRGSSPAEIAQAEELLNPAALTIGFARRFATYKRANLLFRDINRLAEILSNEQRPVQIIFAGKAHPRDDAGKALIRQIIHHGRKEPFRHHMVFLENYDMALSRYLVQGCDVWLNTPRRPREASGTSGMKAAVNGALNVSTLDGWWDEAYRPEIGWAIGNGEVFDDFDYQDAVEAGALYDLLEEEIIPLFYDRDHTGLPRRWIAKVKASMATVCQTFNTVRMVNEYAERFYMPGHEHYQALMAENAARARELAAWKQKLRKNWVHVHFVKTDDQLPTEVRIGTESTVRAVVRLGHLAPTDVRVEIYHGALDGDGQITNGTYIPMSFVQTRPDGTHEFAGALPFPSSGLRGYTLRIVPSHPDLSHTYEPGLIRWA